MRCISYNKPLDILIDIIDCKLSLLNEYPSDYLLLYPEDEQDRLSDYKMRTLLKTIEDNFQNSDREEFSSLLRSYLDNRKIRTNDLYNSALIEKSYFYQLLKNTHTPSRDTAIRIALALKLSLEESNDLLKTLGYSFFEKSRRDIIVTECLNHETGLYIAELLLDRYEEVSLCNKSIINKD